MDSGNSGSMSSSCGDDQEHVLNSFHPTMQFGDSSDHNNNNSDSNLISQYQSNTLFDLSSNYLQPFSQNLRSDQVPNFTAVTRPDHQQQEPNCTNNNNLPGSTSSAALPVKPTNLIRKTKKRTRVSKRAPTTVLTTDTSNFRAMVQEFTGIAAPPFSAGLTSSLSYSRRFDSIFGSSAGSLYPIRPLAQKVQSSSSSLLMSNSTSTNFGASSTSNDMNMNNFTFNHQGLIPHHQSMMLNMQNPILSAFQSSSSSLPHHHEQLQQPTPFHSTSSSIFGAPKPNFEFTALPLHSSEEQLGMPMSHGHDGHGMRWRDLGGLGSVAGVDGRGVVVLEDHGGNHLMRPNLDHHGMG